MQERGDNKCGANTRNGETCKNGAMPNGRCRMHGGKSPGGEEGNTNALKHGIYSSALQEDEKQLWERIEIGTIDDELRMARLQYMRALKADKPELAEKLLGRIASMEKTRFEMQGDGEQDTPFDALVFVPYED